jgi:hypothetical protein
MPGKDDNFIAASDSGPRRRRNREKEFARLNLARYNSWQEKRSEIRRWLVAQIAERAIEIFKSRRTGS